MELTGRHKGYYKDKEDKKDFVEIMTLEDRFECIIVDSNVTDMRSLKGIIKGEVIEGYYASIIKRDVEKFEFKFVEGKLEGYITEDNVKKDYVIEISQESINTVKATKVKRKKVKKKKD